MLRRSFLCLTDSYKEFSTQLMNKLKSSRTALELQASVKNIIVKESEIDVKKLPKKVREQISHNPKHGTHYINGRRITVVNTLLTQCQTKKLWQQAIVVYTTALAMKVPMKPNWEKMVLSSAPNEKARSEIRSRLNLQHTGGSSTNYDLLVQQQQQQPHHHHEHHLRHQQQHYGSNQNPKDNRPSSSSSASDHPSQQSRRDDFSAEDAVIVTGEDDALLASSTNNNNINSSATDFFSSASDENHRVTSLSNHHSSSSIAHISLNPLFDQYYIKQKLAKSGTDLALLTEALKKRPVTCFRVNMSYAGWQAVSAAAAQMPLVEPVPWYQSNPVAPIAFQVDFDHHRRVMMMQHNNRQDNSNNGELNNTNTDLWTATLDTHSVSDSDVKRTRDWMRKMSEEGLISIQSPSSLFVGSLVDPSPSDVVLDMCAAPGSKTRQIVDSMTLSTVSTMNDNNNNSSPSCAPLLPSGVVIANETSSSRHHLLSHLLCTNGRMSNVAVTKERGERLSVFPRVGMWDKILVDAPCSGEGMLHKFPSQWSSWTPSWGIQHHQNQVALLKRAVELVKEGGKIVYSTCTMNPIENEAVVNAVLDHFGEDVLTLEEIPRASWLGLKRMERERRSFSATMQSSNNNNNNNEQQYSSFLSRGLDEWMVPIPASSSLGPSSSSQQPFLFQSCRKGGAPGESTNNNTTSGGDDQHKQLMSSKSVNKNAMMKRVPSTLFMMKNGDDVVGMSENNNTLRKCLRITPSNYSGFDAFFVAILRKVGRTNNNHFITENNDINRINKKSSSTTTFAKTNTTVAMEANRLRKGLSQGETIVNEIMNHFFGSPAGSELLSSLREDQKFILEQRQEQDENLSSEKQQELILSGEKLPEEMTKEERLIKSTSSKPLAVRILSEKAWHLATDENAFIKAVCPGNVFARVSYNKEEQQQQQRHHHHQVRAVWKLTHFGANTIGLLGADNTETVIRNIPLTMIKMILSANGGVIQNIEKELLTDDIAKIGAGKDLKMKENSTSNNDETDDLWTKAVNSIDEKEVWKRKLLLLSSSSSSNHNQNKNIILHAASPSGADLFIPCEISQQEQQHQTKSSNIRRLVCHLDHGERRRLLLLLSQLSALPKKYDSPPQNKWKKDDRGLAKREYSQDPDQHVMTKRSIPRREVFEV